jgi:hypothetical protein
MVDESGPQGIPLYVTEHSQQVPVVLDWEGLEASLPDPSGRAVPQVIPMRVGRQQPVHPAADVALLARRYHHVEMVGHQAKGQQFQADALLRCGYKPEERLVLRRTVEHGRTVITAIDDVVIPAGDQQSATPCHVPRFFQLGSSFIRQIDRE